MTMSTDEKGELTHMTCSSERCWKSVDSYFFHLCPACEQVDSEKNPMIYLPKRRAFYSESCNLNKSVPTLKAESEARHRLMLFKRLMV
jgi:hypothetical protein